MFALADMVDFFAHEFTRLGAWRFAFGFVFGGTSLGSFFGHVGFLELAVGASVFAGCVPSERERSREGHEQHLADATLLGECLCGRGLCEREAFGDRDFERTRSDGSREPREVFTIRVSHDRDDH